MMYNRRTILRQVLSLPILLLLALPAWAQQPAASSNPQDTAKQEVEVDHADLFEYIQQGDTVVQKLNGNVELRQDSIYMYCDTAKIKNQTQVFANGSVIIQQGDSLNVFSDSAAYNGISRIAELFGDVILEKGAQRLFTDRLTYDLSQKLATYQNGATLTLDSTQLTSKKGYYYVDEKQIYFKDSVVVIDSAFTLLSDTLGFNTETRVVDFLGPTLIDGDSTRLYCEDGFYDTENEVAEFTQNAQYQKGEQVAVADTIRYDGERDVYILRGNAIFKENEREATADVIEYNQGADRTVLFGNARYKDDKQDISADEITYDAKRETYATRGRSLISDPPQLLLADQVDYSEERGIGIATGNVIWRDTSEDLTIVCDTADYDRKSDYLKAFGGRNGRPLLITMVDGDSLFMASDTLLALQDVFDTLIVETAITVDTLFADSLAMDFSIVDSLIADTLTTETLVSDSARLLRAYPDVRIYKSDMQAICDSLSYSTRDSTFRLFREPIVWADTSQFDADTVNILLNNGSIDRIFLRNNALIVNSPDEIMFNQVKGKHVTAFFEEEELRRMAVNGNAESVYYALDEQGGYVGVNKTICSEMMLYFGNNEVEKIKFYTQPKAEMLPMGQANHNTLKLDGFFWETQYRPDSLPDLFSKEKKRVLKPLPKAAAPVADSLAQDSLEVPPSAMGLDEEAEDAPQGQDLPVTPAAPPAQGLPVTPATPHGEGLPVTPATPNGEGLPGNAPAATTEQPPTPEKQNDEQ